MRSILSPNGPVRRVRLLLRSLILLTVFATVEAPAQRLSGEEGRPYFVQRFAPADYRQHEQNWCVVQDRRGRIFVANRVAVLEFDGAQWRSHAIPGRFARSLAVAPDGAVCVGGVGEIGCLRPDSLGSLRFESLLPHLPETEGAFSDVWGTHAVGDAVLFQTHDRIMRWDGDSMAVWRPTGQFHKAFAVGSRYFVRDEGRGLLELRGDALVMAPGGALFADERIDAMLPGGQDGILVVSRTRGLLRWQGERLTALRSEVDDAIRGERIYHGIGLTDSTFALGTTSGRVIIGHVDGTLVTVLGTDVGLRPDELVLDLFQDSQGGLWLALDSGILRVDAPTPLTMFDQAQGLVGAVYQILGHRKDTYVATSQGLFRLQRSAPGHGPARFVSLSRLRQQVWDILVQGGRMLAATNEGIYEVRSDGELRRVLDQRAFAMHSPSPSSRMVYVGLNSGIAILEQRGSGWHLIETIGADEIIEARSLASTPDGTLWAVTLSGHLYRLRREGGMYRVERLAGEQGVPDRVGGIHLGSDGRLWLLNPDGVYAFNRDEGRFARDPRFDSLIDFSREEGYLFAAGPSGVTWVINAGVIRAFRHENGTIHEVTPPALGLSGLPVRLLAFDADGVVWISAEQGLLRFDPRISRDYAVPYTALIRRVTSTGHLLFGGAGAGQPHVPRVPFHQNNFRFEVAAPSFNQPEATQYQFWLEGFEAGWSDWSAERFKEYTNLREGRYRFHVRARNVHGVISEVDTFAFTVLPPWHRTWWAYLLYVIAAVAVISGYGRWRLRKHLQEMERDRQVRRAIETANQRLIEANRRLHEADRLKDDLLANTSHELRTPLTAILGFADVLREELDTPGREFAEHILRSGQRLLQTVDGLLNMARLQADTMELRAETFDLASAVRDAAERLRPDAERKQLFLKVFPENVPVPVHLDPTAVASILANLIGNAIKFTERGGVTVLVDADADEVHLTVRDTGIGITEEFLPQLFMPFKQASSGYGRVFEGSGIGLAVTYRLVQLLGGEISVETQPGEGTTFLLRLPRRAEDEPPEASTPVLGRFAGARALILADGGRPPNALQASLSSVMQVECAQDLAAACAHLRERAYELVLVDGHLLTSNMDAVLEALRREPGTSGAAILAFTDPAFPGAQERFIELGFDGHVAGPFTAKRVLFAIEGVLGQAVG